VPPPSLSWHVDSHDGLIVLTVRGTVDASSSSALYQALTHWLIREPVAVLVDLSGATIADPEAATTFSEIVQQADLWPGTPVGICAPDPFTASMIMNGSGESLPLFDTVADGRSALSGRAAHISELIVPGRGAARCARDIATEACARWDLPHLTAPAALVASELVTNAVVHAHTRITLQLLRRPRYLYLAVFDGSHTEPIPQRGHSADAPGGRGLQMVELVSTRWGYQRHHDGKVVWASFATSSTS
jgi:anti-sigma regulatory factor (Ser/Thr protein kinase)